MSTNNAKESPPMTNKHITVSARHRGAGSTGDAAAGVSASALRDQLGVSRHRSRRKALGDELGVSRGRELTDQLMSEETERRSHKDEASASDRGRRR